ncbi:MAG: YceD family protein, partial [Candidatus Hydrogenedentota bacterium]
LLDELRQQMVLSLPMKFLCRDDCLGLCPVCGENRNIRHCGHKLKSYNTLATQLEDIKDKIERLKD